MVTPDGRASVPAADPSGAPVAWALDESVHCWHAAGAVFAVSLA
jgi:hypothetical protein